VDSGVLRVVSLYLPNGNPVDSEKYPYKLAWMERLHAWAEDRLALEEPLILAGDYNVIPQPEDCHDPKVWEGDALFLPQTRAAFHRLVNLGFTEAVRTVTEAPGTYTFWDYQAGAWQKNNGIRIDHLLMSPEAAVNRRGRPRSTNMCAGGKSRRITCRWSSITPPELPPKLRDRLPRAMLASGGTGHGATSCHLFRGHRRDGDLGASGPVGQQLQLPRQWSRMSPKARRSV
jgi:hypothetical protein